VQSTLPGRQVGLGVSPTLDDFVILQVDFPMSILLQLWVKNLSCRDFVKVNRY
jgi:hypothetical protein